MIEILNGFVNDYSISEYTGFIIALVLTLVGFIKFVFEKIKEEKNEIIEKHLISVESINAHSQKINQLIKYHPSLYKNLLEDTLIEFSKLLGNIQLFSSKAFEKHFTYSLIYSFAFFYLVWFFGGDGTVGQYQFIPNNNRLIISTFLIFTILFFLYFFRKLEMACWQIYSAILTLISISIVIIGMINHNIFFLIGGLTGVIIQAVVLNIYILIIPFIILLIIVGLGLFIELEKTTMSNIIFYLFFFFILPFINSIFDYISMYFSRFFAYKILKTNSKGKIILDLFLDFFIAFILLYSLAQTLFYVIDLINTYFIKDELLFIPIQFYKEQFLINPFGQDVLWITLMFISTLIPTLLHFFLATYSFLAYLLTKPHLHELVLQLNELKANDPNYLKKEEIANGLVYYRLSSIIKLYLFVGTVLIIILVITILMLLLKKGLYVL